MNDLEPEDLARIVAVRFYNAFVIGPAEDVLPKFNNLDRDEPRDKMHMKIAHWVRSLSESDQQKLKMAIFHTLSDAIGTIGSLFAGQYGFASVKGRQLSFEMFCRWINVDDDRNVTFSDPIEIGPEVGFRLNEISLKSEDFFAEATGRLELGKLLDESLLGLDE
jgi:hypothetical protein